ncbi:hypothetical protein MPTK1_5g08100 [Marchantia polymorpha subsp. ruderalis]|uniref:Uncharacterized protein n=2 Tax=Marchantia polymorpha TaxID=3197 RepID=A0AAF6BG44_MARPO|nr:hypothetical protein MARPO_0086s0014 [Marchantia polymorpha]PTQ33677.1 hypothetical protein MARPO_0086s0014 [Marchantia polymorpha]BBN10978.1 hypothetical protein Mp_5g08100 [Marchantia polymorpha subsp. ruderalis]BBN10979.1 hypothetical protein Mp_5g08100 [Marchantia polymorpha subsp. ruderalis]|eukprot:PTQ33676.1 hypothetical protein MARPO_0086s0014 [Marchantia polymorpha]
MEVENTSGGGGQDLMELEAGCVARERTRRFDDSSAALAEKLLQGWTLLNEHCPQCLTPLVRNRQKQVYCAVCKQWVLSEAEAAAKALQQRVDRTEAAEQALTASSAQQLSTTPSVTSGNQGPPSPGHRSNGKGNAVNLSRLSLSNLRSEDEKVQEGRNPKRFASSEPGNDGTARTVMVDGKENGTSRPGITAGSFQAPDAGHATSPSLQSKPALALQPAEKPFLLGERRVANNTLSTLNEKLESIQQLIHVTQDVNELRQLFVVLEECIHAIEITRNHAKSAE